MFSKLPQITQFRPEEHLAGTWSSNLCASLRTSVASHIMVLLCPSAGNSHSHCTRFGGAPSSFSMCFRQCPCPNRRVNARLIQVGDGEKEHLLIRHPHCVSQLSLTLTLGHPITGVSVTLMGCRDMSCQKQEGGFAQRDSIAGVGLNWSSTPRGLFRHI